MPNSEFETFCSGPVSPEEMVGAVAAARRAGRELQALLDTFSAPIYLTDADGWVTFYNRACADFAGREPVAGEDRWCVTWKLYTQSGELLPHDRCPMAMAIRKRRKVRGVVAVCERPDGTRVTFTPYPTPIVGADGALIGAVNILIDVTDNRQAEALRGQARRCRRLALSVTDARTIATLRLMADEYEAEGARLAAPAPDAAEPPPAPLNLVSAG